MAVTSRLTAVKLKNVESRTRRHLTDSHLEGFMQTVATVIKSDLKDYSSKSSVKYLSKD